MAAFLPNDRVVCIDATPIPIGAPGCSLPDFSFPGGHIEEGQIYRVDRVINCSNDPYSLVLTGYPVLLHGQEISWNSQRFRKLKKLAQPQAQQEARSLSHAQTSPHDPSTAPDAHRHRPQASDPA